MNLAVQILDVSYRTGETIMNNIGNLVCVFVLFEMVLANDNTSEFNYYASVPL